MLVQYGHFLKNLAHGEMGRSIVYKMPVLGLVAERIQATLFLLGYGVVLALALDACRSRSRAALHRGRWPDHLIRMFSTAGLGFPAFWLGIMLMIVFSVRLGLFPVSGYGEGFLGHLHHLFLPALGDRAGALGDPHAQSAGEPARRARRRLRRRGARQGPAGALDLRAATCCATR